MVATLGITASAVTTPDMSTIFTSNIMDGLLDMLWAILPVILPIVLAIIGFRLAWNFFRSAVR
jgi:hypothetical protein